jgi:hypothetical protein
MLPLKKRTSDDIHAFLLRQVEFWNTGKKTEMFLLYHQIVPGKLTIEYVGLPVLEGWTALEDIWQRYAGKVRIDIHEVLVTGQEAACYLHNTTLGTGTAARPSIELYRFDGDDLHIRYFHTAQL